MIAMMVARPCSFRLLFNSLLLTITLTLSDAARAQFNDDAARTAAELASLATEIAAIQALLERWAPEEEGAL